MKNKTLSHILFRVLVIVIMAVSLVPVSRVHADSCLVTTDADSGADSLREKTADPVCDMITFDGDYTIVLASHLIIDRNVTIDGVGHSVTVSGNDAVRVFVVNSGVTLNLHNLTVANGYANIHIPGIFEDLDGGGIYNQGTLHVTNSLFSGNRATWGWGHGGAIFNITGTVTLINTTFYGNGAMFGGSIYNYQGVINVTNSSFSGNMAGAGSGILSIDGTATVNNSILANYSGSDDSNCNYDSAIVGSNNLANDESCGPGFVNSPSILLGPLADNGGSTQTMALLPGSAAIDAGDDDACPITDQRGIVRPQGAHCDIGAYEAEIDTTTAPTAKPGGPYLGAVNTSIAFDGSLSTDLENDPLTYAWTFGDGATGTSAAPMHSYIAAGIYNVCLTVNDGSLDSEPACTMAVAYDPSAGFVTGGGWITSPAGAYKEDEDLSGKATFGFVSKYQKGASVPTGTTAFQFDLAGLAFSSQSYEWLVVNQGATNAQFKGSGLINGAADPNGNPYKFMIWAGDDSPDTFRIRIWYETGGEENVVYDNDAAQAIGAGNIVVHTSK